ncbi:MAG: hypothetical protein ACO1OB_20620 [Archangium sp.]
MERKRTSGCLLAAVIVGAVLGSFCLVLALLVWSTPSTREAFSQLKRTAGVALKARKAIGTKELRELGCSDAYVVEVKDVPDQFVDAGAFEVIVTCHVREKTPSCDEVAAAYRAVPGSNPGALRVVVMRADGSHACEVDA